MEYIYQIYVAPEVADQAGLAERLQTFLREKGLHEMDGPCHDELCYLSQEVNYVLRHPSGEKVRVIVETKDPREVESLLKGFPELHPEAKPAPQEDVFAWFGTNNG